MPHKMQKSLIIMTLVVVRMLSPYHEMSLELCVCVMYMSLSQLEK